MCARCGGDAARLLPANGRMADGCVTLLSAHALVMSSIFEARVVTIAVDDVSAAVDVTSRIRQKMACYSTLRFRDALLLMRY